MTVVRDYTSGVNMAWSSVRSGVLGITVPAESPRAAARAAQAAQPERQDASPLPLFYRNPRPVDADRHARMGLPGAANLQFAAGTNSIPINAAEFAVASKHYPIVFSAQPPHLPVVIIGLRNNENAFVTEEFRWVAGFYVPAYVRRYPFIFMENPERRQFILCVDEGSGLMVEGGERRLFDDGGKPTDLTNRALDFCRAFHAQHEVTRQFVQALGDHGLLIENSTEIRLSEGRRVEMQGYMIVDRERFEGLGDEVFLEWRRLGWLPLIYSHLISGSNWPAILQQTARRAAARGA